MAGVPKALQEEILGKVLRQGDSVTEAAVRSGRQASGAKAVGSFDQRMQQALEEYETSMNIVDQQVVTPKVAMDIDLAKQVDKEEKRAFQLFNPVSDPQFHVQTVSPEEFSERMVSQLRNPEYSIKAILEGPMDTGFVKNLQQRQANHTALVETVTAGVKKDKRWTANVESFQGADSPYANDLMFHVDRISDSSRPNSFIQYEDPKEFGLHSGTNAAAERVVGAGGIEDAIMSQSKIQQDIVELEGMLDLPGGALEDVIGGAINSHVQAIFNKNPQSSYIDTSAIWMEVEEVVGSGVRELGGDSQEISKFLTELKNLPAPSTTPTVFAGKNGLLLRDAGSFNPQEVSSQLQDIFPDKIEEILAATSIPGRAEKTKALQKFIEDQGYDHIVYHNAVEDRGSLSIINWNPDLQKSIWDPSFTRNDPNIAAKAVTSYMLGVLGISNANTGKEKPEA